MAQVLSSRSVGLEGREIGLEGREVLSEVTVCLARPEDPDVVVDCTPVIANSSQEEKQQISSDVLSLLK